MGDGKQFGSLLVSHVDYFDGVVVKTGDRSRSLLMTSPSIRVTTVLQYGLVVVDSGT